MNMALYEPLFRMLDCQLAIHAKLGRPPLRTGSNDAYGWGLDASRPPFFCVQASTGEWFLTSVPGAQVAQLLTGATDGVKDRRSDRQRFAAWARTLAPTALRDALTRAGGDIVPVLDGMGIAKNKYLGADTVEALAACGLVAAAIDRLRRAGAIL